MGLRRRCQPPESNRESVRIQKASKIVPWKSVFGQTARNSSCHRKEVVEYIHKQLGRACQPRESATEGVRESKKHSFLRSFSSFLAQNKVDKADVGCFMAKIQYNFNLQKKKKIKLGGDPPRGKKKKKKKKKK